MQCVAKLGENGVFEPEEPQQKRRLTIIKNCAGEKILHCKRCCYNFKRIKLPSKQGWNRPDGVGSGREFRRRNKQIWVRANVQTLQTRLNGVRASFYVQFGSIFDVFKKQRRLESKKNNHRWRYFRITLCSLRKVQPWQGNRGNFRKGRKNCRRIRKRNNFERIFGKRKKKGFQDPKRAGKGAKNGKEAESGRGYI